MAAPFRGTIHPMNYRDPHERFWEKVDRDGLVPETRPELGPCWIWTASLHQSNGGLYGAFRLPRSRKMIPAHRWAWEEEHGAVPDGKILDHLCRVTACVRPSHLEVVTGRENILRGTNTAARWAKRTHCEKGHAFTAENTRITKARARLCRTCRRVASREEKARARERRHLTSPIGTTGR